MTRSPRTMAEVEAQIEEMRTFPRDELDPSRWFPI